MRIPEHPPIFLTLLKTHSQDIQKVLNNAELKQLSARCESQYWSWPKLKYAANAKHLNPELVWLLARLSRDPRYKNLPLHGHKGLPLRFIVPDRLQHELMLIDHQLSGNLSSDDASPPSASQREQFIITALREEAIASSMLEGAVTTRQEAKQMLQSGRRPRNQGERMVLNNYQAIQFIREHRNAGMSPEFLLEIQRILTDKTLGDPSHVGRFRTDTDDIKVVDVRDNEVMHSPPAASELAVRLKALCDFANSAPQAKSFIHPVVAACILHFQVGFDHPFCDGNGRTARAVFYWMMLRRGYWLFEYLPLSRLILRAPTKYARAFLYCETDNFDVTYFLMYQSKIIATARKELKEYISKKQEKISQAKRLFSSDRRLNYRQNEVILRATRNPTRFFTIASHQREYGIAYGTGRSDCLQLAKWKYLTKHRIGKRFEFLAGPKILETQPPANKSDQGQ